MTEEDLNMIKNNNFEINMAQPLISHISKIYNMPVFIVP